MNLCLSSFCRFYNPARDITRRIFSQFHRKSVLRSVAPVFNVNNGNGRIGFRITPSTSLSSNPEYSSAAPEMCPIPIHVRDRPIRISFILTDIVTTDKRDADIRGKGSFINDVT